MGLGNLEIHIVDTQENTRVLQYELTEDFNPVLKYSGSDDKFQAVMSSSLAFNMLVPNAEDGQYMHLFTGSESRYLVKLINAIDASVIWQGHLLPDMYDEPYENGAFFVNFTATDGFGQLSNKYLPDDFYQDKKSIIQVIAECLKLTNNSFQIFATPSITNAVQEIRMDDIYVKTKCYRKKSSGKENAFVMLENAFDILEYVVKSIGCKVLQQNATWYLVGINRQGDAVFEFEQYDSDGLFVGLVTEDRVKLKPRFLATPPSMTMLPPNKSVIVDWDKKSGEDMLPDDIVYQLTESTDSNVLIGEDVKYWKIVGDGAFLGLHSIKGPIDIEITGISQAPLGGGFYLPKYTWTSFDDIFYVTMSRGIVGVPFSAGTCRIELMDPVYVRQSEVIDKKLTIKIGFVAYISHSQSVADAVTGGFFDSMFHYKILINDVARVDNFSNTEWNFELNYSNGKITGILEIDDLFVKESGYLQIHLYYPQDYLNHKILKVGYDEVSIVYKTDDFNRVELIRDIDYSSVLEPTVFHGSCSMELSDRNFVFRPDLVVDVPAIITVDYRVYLLSILDPQTVKLMGYRYYYFTKYAFDLLKKHYANVYVKDAAGDLSNFYMHHDRFWDVTAYGGGLLYWTSPGEAVLDMNSEIWVKTSEQTNAQPIKDETLIRNQWKRTNAQESEDFIKCLGRVYHDVSDKPFIKIEGVIIGLVNPLSLLQFYYAGENRNFIVTDLTLNLVAGETSVVLNEYNTILVDDYEQVTP